MSQAALQPAHAIEGASNETWQNALSLSCDLQVVLPIPKFTVRDLLRLDRESVVDTRWGQNLDLPVRVNGKLIGWAEFEVSGETVAIRFTEMV